MSNNEGKIGLVRWSKVTYKLVPFDIISFDRLVQYRGWFYVSFFNQLRGISAISRSSQMYEYTVACCNNNSLFTLQTISLCPLLTVNFANDQRDICPTNLITKYLNDGLNNLNDIQQYLNPLSTSTFHISDNNSKILNFPIYIQYIRCFRSSFRDR